MDGTFTDLFTSQTHENEAPPERPSNERQQRHSKRHVVFSDAATTKPAPMPTPATLATLTDGTLTDGTRARRVPI